MYGSQILDTAGTTHVKGMGEGDVWVFGHTHFTTKFKANGVQVYANQLGPRELLLTMRIPCRIISMSKQPSRFKDVG